MEAETTGAAADAGAVLIDATDFFLRDAHGVLDALVKQGPYKLDAARSSIVIDATRVFPKNTEIEAVLTFASDAPLRGSFVAEVAPDPHALTVREHHSFLELPEPGYAPRRYDPRAGYFQFVFRDYAAALGAPLDQMFILRHRLIKQDPTCVSGCAAVKPIQYYVDRGAPEPIRSALIEGAGWWDQAFRAAGWAPGTFRVEALPEGADPMDARYNIIQWVHRFTRGWSYGPSVADPRTGEIIKGNVTLGSLRGRQDYLIAEALLSPYVAGKAMNPEADPMLIMALARTRQLAAHETGHTLGLAHNFAASSFPHVPTESVSVMDYPHPWITLDKNGVPDLSSAYASNIGIWDKVTINYGYRQFSTAANERFELDAILNDATKSGLVYISDEDARPAGGAHPFAHLWDNGQDAAEELIRILKIRAAALSRFGENAIPMGAPMAQLARHACTAVFDASLSDRGRHQGNRWSRLPLPTARRRATRCRHRCPGRTKQGAARGGDDAVARHADPAGIPAQAAAAPPPGICAHCRIPARTHRTDIRSHCRCGIRGGSYARHAVQRGARRAHR